MQRDFSERYSRQLRLRGFGPEAQQKLAKAKVLVVGAGGLGVPVLQYLTGMGVGHIGVADDDVVSLSNLHRQVLYATEDIGRSKASVAIEKLLRLNPEIALQPFHKRLDASWALDAISAYDLVVDASDNISTRYLINDACVILNKPFVYGAIQGYEGHVSVFNFKDGPTYRCLYPAMPTASEIPDCNTGGVLGVVPGIVGTMQALQAVKSITGVGQCISGYLQVFDFLNDEQYKVRLKANPANKQITELAESYGDQLCSNPGNMIQPEALRQWLQERRLITLIDVREADEYKVGHIPGAQNVPLSGFDNLGELADAKPLIVYCQKGSRSAKAFALLQNHGGHIFELAGGYDNWINTAQQP